MEVINFSLGRLPYTMFFAGAIAQLPFAVEKFGKKILLVTGGSSLKKSGRLDAIERLLKSKNIYYAIVTVHGEPSPQLVDAVVKQFADKEINAVVSIGGGSVIDAGKAISAMLPLNESVYDYLEVVGTKLHGGVKIPFIAIPTTAGTGSEATKNAVLSTTGTSGFKRSLRHNNFVPDIAIIDPELMIGCPFNITAASGLDALTQLIESYVSTKANPFTDALSLSGIEKVQQSLLPLCIEKNDSIPLRAGMAYAAYVSGITLAHAGLGIVHGLASPLGALFGIPHGVACGTLLAAAARTTIIKLKSAGDTKYLQKYAKVGELLAPEKGGDDRAQKTHNCIHTLEEWTETLAMPRLSMYGVREQDFAKIIKEADNKNNPIHLNDDEMIGLLRERL